MATDSAVPAGLPHRCAAQGEPAPFFGTKREGHGIGLAVVQQIVTQQGGEVKVSSSLGDGSTFRVWWPSEVPG